MFPTLSTPPGRLSLFTTFCKKEGPFPICMQMCLNPLSLLFPAVPEVEDVIAVEGHTTQLPCDISPPTSMEQVYLVLWYRHDEGEPIYR